MLLRLLPGPALAAAAASYCPASTPVSRTEKRSRAKIHVPPAPPYVSMRVHEHLNAWLSGSRARLHYGSKVRRRRRRQRGLRVGTQESTSAAPALMSVSQLGWSLMGRRSGGPVLPLK